MGYYVNTMSCDVCIPAENAKAAYDAMCALNWRNDLKNGGRWPRNETDTDGPRDDIWFSWMHWNYHEIYQSAEEILRELGFDVMVEDNGDIWLVSYDSKIGAERDFLNAIAPFITDGSSIEWAGEDGTMWRQLFKDGKMIEQDAKIVWE